MKQYNAANIRNICLTGHGGAGKTSLAEAMLFFTGSTDRLGKVADGNTLFDFDPEEIKRKTSVSTSVAPIEWKDYKINIIDTPGLFDFAGGICEGMRAAECAVIAVSGKSGVTVGVEKAVDAAAKRGIAKIFFVGKLDSDNADFYKCYEALQSEFGSMICPIIIPYYEEREIKCYVNLLSKKAFTYKDGKATDTAMPDLGGKLEEMTGFISEAVAETDDALMEKYFSGEEFTVDELVSGLSMGVKSGAIAPVYCGSALQLTGIDQLLEGIIQLAPDAIASAETATTPDGESIELTVDEQQKVAAIVFRTVADPFVGKLSYFKVISGKVTPDSQLVNSRTGAVERIGKVLTVRGKKQLDTTYVPAGDIGAVAKLTGTNTGDTLASVSKPVALEGVQFPAPILSMAVKPKAKGDEEKISAGLHRLMEEDPTISVFNNTETHQLILSGMGEQHLDVIASKLKAKFGVDLELTQPKVAYRETIRKKVRVEGRHKKQTGGHGQFGHVWIEFEPCDSDDLVFADKVFGGAVPKGFFPAVEKGLRDCIFSGVLAGYPVVGLKATLVDGSYHPVDSSEMSFKMAATLAYKNGLPTASPVLLEPIGTLKVYIPENNMGDIIGEVNKRRGRVLGMNPGPDKLQEVVAETPMAEMHDFSTYVRQVTQGRGYFSLDFERYEEAPPMVANKVIDAKKAESASA